MKKGPVGSASTGSLQIIQLRPENTDSISGKLFYKLKNNGHSISKECNEHKRDASTGRLLNPS